jgi:hypothetical protein
MRPALAVEQLASIATLPYRRGAEVLSLPLGLDIGGWTTVPPYAFADYKARWGGDPPAPRYLLVPRFPTGRDPLTVEIELDRGGPPSVVTLTLPPGTPDGLSFAIPLEDGDGPELRVRRLRPVGVILPGPGADCWRLVALLGNVAKLLWVVGREQDELAALLEEVRLQRHLPHARAASLDLQGRDLRVPRFPAREHSFDPATRALYHLSQHPVADGGVFDDETGRFGPAGHPATAHGQVSGGRGKFGNGIALPGPSGDGHLTIAPHADFDLPAGADFTVDLFAQVAPEAAVRALLVKGPLDAGGDLTGDGWSLTLGSFRGTPNNLRWAVRAGASGFALFADLDLADGRFHHLAAVLDRTGGRARLFVDGVERAAAAVAALPAVANALAVFVGRSAAGHPLTGVIDELRFSAAARTDFHPVLGEGDDAYRRRLALFGRWLLPTPGELLAALNSAVAIAGDPAPLVLVERDRPLATGSRGLRLVPALLSAGAHIDAAGGLRSTVEEVCGRPEDEPGFQAAVLFRHDHPQALYDSENARRMHAAAADFLDELAGRLTDQGTPGNLVIEAAYDPQASNLQRVGRAVVFHHQVLPSAGLAALAHRAGFDWVEHRSGRVFAAVAPSSHLRIDVEAPPPADRPLAGDIFAGKGLNLAVLPASLPGVARLEWTVIRCGPGRARFEPHPADPPALKTPLPHRRRLRLVTESPGEIVVSLEARLGGTTFTGSRTVRIVPAELKDGDHIAGDGDLTTAEADAVGTPEDDFDPAFLVEHASGVSFAPGPETRLMQVGLDRTLERLAELLGPPAARAQLTVLLSFVPGNPDLHGVGRAVRLRHAVMPAAALASLAHQAGFGWVRRDGTDVYASVAAGEALEIVQTADGRPLPAELVIDAPLAIQVRQKPPAGGLNWSVDPIAAGRARLSSVLRRETVLTPTVPGLAAVSVFHLGVDAGATPPYTFEIRLNPALEAAKAIVPKPEYDLIMNILHYFHPLGVEVLTRRLREHVVEVRDNLLNAFPGYTFPDFRV